MSELGLDQLISVSDAIRKIDDILIPQSMMRSSRFPESPAMESMLGRDVISDRDYPPFDKSLMDGFAVRSADLAQGSRELGLVGEVAAGGSAQIAIPPGTCVAIMTGAQVPRDADAVVPVEMTHVVGDAVRFTRAAKPGDAISHRGADLREGEPVLPRGARIGPAQVGALVQVGAFELIPTDLFNSNSPLRGHVLVTGDEIVGESESPGLTQIRDVNGPMLAALLGSMGVRCERSRVIDDAKLTRESIDRLSRANDITFVTGGMSMGKYDYVPRVLVELGFDLRITKVKIKPGKPFVFATRTRPEKTDFVFGLPGNPVSSFCCTVRLASRLVDRLHGRSPRVTSAATLQMPLALNGPREFYQPAILQGSDVTPLNWKGSADVFTLARASALIVRPQDDPAREIGETVSIVRW